MKDMMSRGMPGMPPGGGRVRISGSTGPDGKIVIRQ